MTEEIQTRARLFALAMKRPAPSFRRNNKSIGIRMLARRFLWVITGLVMLALAAAFGYRMFGEQLLRAAMVPTVPFAESKQDTAPDYRQPANWIARPDLPGDPARWVPTGFTAAPRPAIAVFYVMPTTYLRRDRWNAPLQDREAEERARLFTQSQASAFNGVGAIWAPRYRQATFGAFLTGKPDAEAALDFAYQDVLAAFETFLGGIPASQPIILAGHSQGSLHLMRLLRDRIAGTPLSRRIVAVYLGGWPVSIDADVPALGLPPCTYAGQTQCIIAWQSFAEPADPGIITKVYDTSTGLTGKPRSATPMLCVNPLTGAPNSSAPPSANIGALKPGADFKTLSLEAGRIGAHCQNGLLLIGQPPLGFGSYVLPGNNFHVYDYALFWANIRADAEARVSNFSRP
jgi:hypothetical protein